MRIVSQNQYGVIEASASVAARCTAVWTAGQDPFQATIGGWEACCRGRPAQRVRRSKRDAHLLSLRGPKERERCSSCRRVRLLVYVASERGGNPIIGGSSKRTGRLGIR